MFHALSHHKSITAMARKNGTDLTYTPDPDLDKVNQVLALFGKEVGVVDPKP